MIDEPRFCAHCPTDGGPCIVCGHWENDPEVSRPVPPAWGALVAGVLGGALVLAGPVFLLLRSMLPK